MKPGDVVWVRVGKADGQPHRWWQATVEARRDDCFILCAPAGNPVYHNPQRFPRALYHQQHHIRSYYWPGRRHTLLEIYRPDGDLNELYADITSPIAVTEAEVRFIDHELDVSQMAGEAPRVVDQDEFAEAAVAFGYAEAFVNECYALAEELVTLLANWTPAGSPYR